MHTLTHMHSHTYTDVTEVSLRCKSLAERNAVGAMQHVEHASISH